MNESAITPIEIATSNRSRCIDDVVNWFEFPPDKPPAHCGGCHKSNRTDDQELSNQISNGAVDVGQWASHDGEITIDSSGLDKHPVFECAVDG